METDLYNNNYLKWKSWNEKKPFGILDSFHKIYFDSELSRTKLKGRLKVLEIGFGNGNFLAYAKSKGWEIIGTEVNPELLKLAREQGYQADTPEAINAQPGPYDLIVAFDVLEHMAQEELPKFLGEMGSKLKPGGIFLARVPNGDSPFSLHDQNGDITHKTILGSGKIRQLAEMTEFELKYIGPPAQPLFCGNWQFFLYRLYSVPLKFIIELFVRIIFYPKTKVSFTSPSIVTILKKPDAI